MRRDAIVAGTIKDAAREAVGLPMGTEGEYCVVDVGWGNPSIIDYNRPPSTQPGLWCGWVPETAEALQWDGGEKFYNYVEWFEYLMANFFLPWGYCLSGEVTWTGEEQDDIGKIVVHGNQVTVKRGEITYSEGSPKTIDPNPDVLRSTQK